MSLRWRMPIASDVAALREVHARQNAAVGIATPFPDLGDRNIRWARVAVREDGAVSGAVVGAVLVRRVAEVWYIADSAATLRSALAEAGAWARELAAAGVDDLRMAVHRSRLRPLERLLARIGWRRSNRECVEFYYERAKERDL